MQNKKQQRTDMFMMIEKWKESKLAKGTFCKEHNILVHVFYYWYGLYKKVSNPSSANFIPLKVVQEQPQTLITIHGENGSKLQVPLNDSTVGFIVVPIVQQLILFSKSSKR